MYIGKMVTVTNQTNRHIHRKYKRIHFNQNAPVLFTYDTKRGGKVHLGQNQNKSYDTLFLCDYVGERNVEGGGGGC